MRKWKMNKQELIKAVEELPANCRGLRPMIDKWSMLELIKLLDEPQKVVVPQFVADWIEEAKKSCETVVEFFGYKFSNIEMIKYLKKKERIDLIARAWLDGYIVEEEKRYLVKIKGDIKENMLVYGELLERYFFTKSLSLDNAIYSHTRKGLEEAGFGWVFDCEGIEIEEIE